MNIIEIPVIGSRRSEKEQLYTLLSDQPLRKFQGLDVGALYPAADSAIYFYFMNQENEEYLYLWDLIIPRAIGCLVVCDLGNSEIFDKNVEVIERMKERYSTELFICSLPVEGEAPAVLKSKGFASEYATEFLYFNPQEKESAKNILLKIIESENPLQ